MLSATCVEKIQGKTKVLKYVLMYPNGERHIFKTNDLKDAMRNNLIEVDNLQLTTNNRLLDKHKKEKVKAKNNSNCLTADKSVHQYILEHICDKTNFLIGGAYCSQVKDVGFANMRFSIENTTLNIEIFANEITLWDKMRFIIKINDIYNTVNYEYAIEEINKLAYLIKEAKDIRNCLVIIRELYNCSVTDSYEANILSLEMTLFSYDKKMVEYCDNIVTRYKREIQKLPVKKALNKLYIKHGRSILTENAKLLIATGLCDAVAVEDTAKKLTKDAGSIFLDALTVRMLK